MRYDVFGQVFLVFVEFVVVDGIGVDISGVEYVDGGFVVEGVRFEG